MTLFQSNIRDEDEEDIRQEIIKAGGGENNTEPEDNK